MRGREFTFTERELGEEGDGTGHDQQLILGTSSLALTRLLTFEDLWFGPDSNFSGLDSDGETSDESYDPNKPEGKTQPRNSVCSRRLRNGKGRGNAQRRVQGSWEALRVKKDSQVCFLRTFLHHVDGVRLRHCSIRGRERPRISTRSFSWMNGHLFEPQLNEGANISARRTGFPESCTI